MSSFKLLKQFLNEMPKTFPNKFRHKFLRQLENNNNKDSVSKINNLTKNVDTIPKGISEEIPNTFAEGTSENILEEFLKKIEIYDFPKKYSEKLLNELPKDFTRMKRQKKTANIIRITEEIFKDISKEICK